MARERVPFLVQKEEALGAGPEEAPRAPAASRIDAVSGEIRKVHFAPRSAPGPSGRRPEHVKEFIGARRHRAGKR